MDTHRSTHHESAHAVPLVEHTDVIVCGGGPAGIAAAIAAARGGARVRLIERYGCLGGVWTAGRLTWILDTEGKPGIMREIFDRLDERDAREGQAADTEQMKLLLEEMCDEAGVDVRLYTSVVAAARDEANRLAVVVTESKSGREAWAGKVFIDCTGDGDLAALAGCGFELGNHEGKTQPMSLIALVSGTGPVEGLTFADRDWGAGTAWLRAEIERGGHCPSYTHPQFFPIRDDLAILMANHQYGGTGLDADHLTRATLAARAEVHQVIAALRSLGGRWSDLRVVATADQIGVREGRRIRGRYQVTSDDLVRGARFDDAVCRVSFPVDVHALDPDKGKGLGNEGVKSQPYDIPYRALVASDCDGLLMAGRCISGDFFAHASYRVTGNAVAMGEAAGTAAAECIKQDCLPHAFSPELASRPAAHQSV